jgi:hypothetical protein
VAGGAGWLEELLAYAGSRHPPKVHIHVQIRTPRAPASRYSGDVALVVAASIAAATSYSTIRTDLNISVIVVGCLLLGTLAALRLVPRAPSPAAIVLAVLIGLVPQLFWPPSGNVEQGPLFHVATGLGMLAGVLLIAAMPLHRRRAGLSWLSLGAMAAATVLVVQSSGHPAIDVWLILQQSTRALLHGANPYTLSFTGIPAGQTSDCFNYLPFTFLGAVPGRVLFGDVRYAELAFLLGGIGMLAWAVRRAPEPAGPAAPAPGGPAQMARAPAGRATLALPLVALALGLPGMLRVAQQSWNESVILGCLAAAVALVLLGRAWWAVVPLALALATKQHVVLVLPLWALWRGFGWRRSLAAAGLAGAICLPWLLAAPGRFYGCTVRFFIDLPARGDSLSVWTLIPGGLQMVAVLALIAAGYLLAVRLLDGRLSGLVFGCGLVFAAFDLANKQSFENQWVLACQLLVLGLACRAAERATAVPEHRPAMRPEGADVP